MGNGMNKKLLEKIINDVSLDERVSNGMFNIEEDAHMDALREYLAKKGIDEESVREFSNRVLEGKYPERQAFNAKGILVTFPTPEYKAEAIKRGTHFEKDPTKGQSNLFSTPSSPKTGGNDKKEEPAPSTPKTSLPVSQASDTPSPDSDTAAKTVQPQTTAAPQQTPVSTPAAEPVKEPTDLPLPPPKSPAEKQADKNAIKTMLKGDDYMLEEVTTYIEWNAPHIMEEIKQKLNL